MKCYQRQIAAACAVFLAGATAVTAASLKAYNFKSFSYPGATYTDGRGINSNGQVVGQWHDSRGASHGFLASGGVYTSFDVPGAMGTFPHGINDAGTIVGSYSVDGQRLVLDATGHLVAICCASYGFIRTADGQYTTIDYPTALAEIPTTWLFGINNLGQVVGGYNDFDMSVPGTSSHGIHSFRYDGAFTSIDFATAAASLPVTYATGINDVGDVVGGYNDDNQHRHGFRLSGGTYSTFDMPDSVFTDLYGLNNFGDIIGETTACSSSAFLYSLKRGFSCIAAQPKQNVVPFLAFGLNDAGQFVGTTGDGSHLGYFATPPGSN